MCHDRHDKQEEHGAEWGLTMPPHAGRSPVGRRLRDRCRDPARPGQVREQRVEVLREDRPSGHLQPHLELVMVEATLGVRVAQGSDRLVALDVAEPVGRVRGPGA